MEFSFAYNNIPRFSDFLSAFITRKMPAYANIFQKKYRVRFSEITALQRSPADSF
jgi:hypothetical protein